MAVPEIKRFAEALVALSNSAIGVAKATDQRIVASKEVIDQLNEVIAQKNQVIFRQRQVISSLAQQYAKGEKELKAVQQELRGYKRRHTSLFDRAELMSADESKEKSSVLLDFPLLQIVSEATPYDSAPLSPTSLQSHAHTLSPDQSSSKRRRTTAPDSAGDDEKPSASSMARQKSPRSI